MFLGIIAIIIFFGSLIGISIIVIPKIPTLVREYPQKANEEKTKSVLREGIDKINPFKKTYSKKFLAKFLLKFKIITLKLENKTSLWIENLRIGTKKSKINFSKDYWDKVESDSEDNQSDKNNLNKPG